MEASIRPATPDDARAITEVNIATWRTAYRGIVPDAHLDDLHLDFDKRVERIREWICSPRTCCVACLDEKVVGFATAGPTRKPQPGYPTELYAIYLIETAQGRGLGRQLVEHIRTDLNARGIGTFWVSVFEQNHSARAFYERLGGTLLPETSIRTLAGKDLHEVAYGWK